MIKNLEALGENIENVLENERSLTINKSQVSSKGDESLVRSEVIKNLQALGEGI